MYKKLIAFITVLTFLTSFSAVPANSAVKAGTACKTAGVTSVVSGKTFTCIKSGKKLVWNRGVDVSKPKVLTDYEISKIKAYKEIEMLQIKVMAVTSI
jgi:hypothetical protein